MNQHLKIPIYFSTLLIFLTGFTTTSYASNNSFIEITQSINPQTFDQISTIGLYAKLNKKHGDTSYGGVQYSIYEKIGNAEHDSIVRVLVGQSIGGTVSPFVEFGTDFYGFLVMLSDNNNDQRCKDNRECAIDAFFRIGLRIKINKTNTLGIFHENIDFGDFHTNLLGEHSYTGASLSFDF